MPEKYSPTLCISTGTNGFIVCVCLGVYGPFKVMVIGTLYVTVLCV